MCDNCAQPLALFKNIFKFCTYLSKFLNILPFFALFLNIAWMPLLSRIGPVQSIKFFFSFILDCFFKKKITWTQDIALMKNEKEERKEGKKKEKINWLNNYWHYIYIPDILSSILSLLKSSVYVQPSKL